MQESSTYYIKSVKDTTFEPDAFGNKFYSIEVEGIQGTLLWKTKNRPNNGISVYGHIEPSKSGKSRLFKRDQKPEDYVEPSQPAYSDSLLPGQTALPGVPTGPVNASQPTNAQIMELIRKTHDLALENNSLLKGVEGVEAPEVDEGAPIDLSEIPF